MKEEINTTKYSLGIEELAMLFGLINRPDLGRALINSVYENLTDDQMDQRLTSASHSLIARGLCGVSPKGMPTLENDVELVLFPLIKYDYLVYANIYRSDGVATGTIHVSKNKAYTAHFIQAGIAHVLESGEYGSLSSYIEDLFRNFGDQPNGKLEIPKDVKINDLGSLLEKGMDEGKIKKYLLGRKWPNETAGALSHDIANYLYRGTVLRVNSDHTATAEAIKNASKQSIMLLKGPDRSWLFNFPSSDEGAVGEGLLANNIDFANTLISFIKAD